MEIKFRGWDKENGNWVYGLPTKNNGKLCVIKNTNSRKVVIKKETLTQYIGVKDKNGKKIFVGDILQFGEEEVEVVFKNSGFQAKYKNGQSDFIGNFNNSNLYIVGNIYKNITKSKQSLLGKLLKTLGLKK